MLRAVVDCIIESALNKDLFFNNIYSCMCISVVLYVG